MALNVTPNKISSFRQNPNGFNGGPPVPIRSEIARHHPLRRIRIAILRHRLRSTRHQLRTDRLAINMRRPSIPKQQRKTQRHEIKNTVRVAFACESSRDRIQASRIIRRHVRRNNASLNLRVLADRGTLHAPLERLDQIAVSRHDQRRMSPHVVSGVVAAGALTGTNEASQPVC